MAINQLKDKMEKAMDYLHQEYGKLQTGRASSALVDGIMVDNYGSLMPLKNIANISIPEAKQIVIQPWDRNMVVAIEKAITNANLGLNPQNDGAVIRLILPLLTEERRKEIVKMVHKYAEDARISFRNSRHDAINIVKNQEKEGEITEDDLKSHEKEIQKLVDEYNKKAEEASKHKEIDVMTV